MFVAGYIATITVDGNDLHPASSSATLSKTTDAIPATTLGITHRKYRNGMKDTSLSVDMHASTTLASALQAADDSTTPVTCVFRAGKLGAGFDLGSYTGSGVITDMTISGNVDDNWVVSLEVQGTEEWPYTQPV